LASGRSLAGRYSGVRPVAVIFTEGEGADSEPRSIPIRTDFGERRASPLLL